MRSDQAALQLGAQLWRNVLRRERAEARRYAVVRRIVAGEVFDDLAARGDLMFGCRAQCHWRPVSRDGDDLGRGQGSCPHDDGVHGIYGTASGDGTATRADLVVSGIPASSASPT